MTQRPIEEIVESMPQNKCIYCDGDGYMVEHDPRDETGQTPMQVQCDYCHAEGCITTLDVVRTTLETERRQADERLREVYIEIEKMIQKEVIPGRTGRGSKSIRAVIGNCRIEDVLTRIEAIAAKHNIDITPNTPQV